MKVVKGVWGWFDDRTGLSNLFQPLLYHPVPPKTGWPYTLGSATLAAFTVQVITGIALSTAYVTSTADAYDSLKFITDDAPFGHMLRGMHFWGASAMVLLIGLHTIRTFLYGSYKFPREVSWLTGTVLLLLTLALAFTGQLLRWDQTAYWSVIVGAKQAGQVPILGGPIADFIRAGSTVGGATLSRFFALHVFFVPAGIFLFVGLHLYLVVRNGISEPPTPGDPVDPKTYRAKYHDLLRRRGVPFWPDAALPDLTMAFIVILGIAVLAFVFGAPALDKPPDPTILQAYPRPDWYFLWYFAVLALIPPATEPFVIVLGPLLLGVLLFLLPLLGNKGERAPSRRPWAIVVVITVVAMVSTFWFAGEQAPWSPAFAAQGVPSQLIGTTSGPVASGAKLFKDRGCIYCHTMGSQGGERGPNLTYVGSRLNHEQLVTRILNGGNNMPAYGGIMSPDDINALVAFLESRKEP
ncbi:MAG: cytochrome b N-terminal domain-containing protein [Chloroflexia bacterium]